MQSSPEKYLSLVYEEIPRLLSLQDRNYFSKSYGSFHRSYWLHRTSDFPAAIAQQGVHTLALLWAHDLPKNPYYQSPKILEWCLAGIRYWMKIQKSDGSFDEWYPNERGWAGPTGYLLHAMVDSYFLIKDQFPAEMIPAFKAAVLKAGHYLLNYNEEYVLANHHAIALLPIYEAYVFTKDESLRIGFEKSFERFLTYCYEEGWSLEYDGADIGYQAGTISFLTRLYKHWPDPRIVKLIEGFVEFTSYHLYPNGSYGGVTGSRQTVHFYPSGYEFWGKNFPLASAMAEKGLQFLNEGKLVAPGTQEDHYVIYRLPEFIEAYLSYHPRSSSLPPLPYERPDFDKYFPKAGIAIKKKESYYSVVNLSRGGVIKVFDTSLHQMIAASAGWICRMRDGSVLTSQWNGPEYQYDVSQNMNLTVSGRGHGVVTKLFTPFKMILFRAFMLLFGWHAGSAYQIKALIRRLLMVGARPGPIQFQRNFDFESDSSIKMRDTIKLEKGVSVQEMHLGGEFPVRYVPQSRYFQAFELNLKDRHLTDDELKTLNIHREITIETTLCAV